MGGNALSETRTRRYSADEYFALKDDVVSALKSILPDARIEDVKAYRQKPDFGDLDVVVENLDAKNRLEPALRKMGISEIVKNGPVWSLGWNDFQVDLLFQASEDYDFACKYFAFNDLGNLIGRTARRFDLKFGHDGLWYMFRDGNYKIADINLTKDFYTALEFLGYSADRYRKGFDSLPDIFHYVTTSIYYDHSAFLLENRTHKARVRDAKRPSYRAFLEYAREKQSNGPVSTLSKDEAMARAREWFPEFARQLDAETRKHEKNVRAKKRFNGQIVSDITGLQGKQLGSFMAYLRSCLPEDKERRNEWILMTSDDVLRPWIMARYKVFQHNMKQ